MNWKFKRGDWIRFRQHQAFTTGAMLPGLVIDEIVYLTQEDRATIGKPAYLTSHGYLIMEADILEART